MLEETDYIALGNLVGQRWPKKVIKAHIDKVFAIIEKYHRRIHLFGYTSRWALLRYPIYSVDSSRWVSEVGGFLKYAHIEKSAGRLQMLKLRDAPGTLQQMESSLGLRPSIKGTYYTRVGRAAKVMHDYGAWLTEVWAARGIVWDDEAHRRAYPDLMEDLKQEVSDA